MIDYNDLGRYYVGDFMPVMVNTGGLYVELGDNVTSLFYKLDDDHYADVNRKGVVAQVLRKDVALTQDYVIAESTLKPIENKEELNANSGLVKRLIFNPKNYKYQSSKKIIY